MKKVILKLLFLSIAAIFIFSLNPVQAAGTVDFTGTDGSKYCCNTNPIPCIETIHPEDEFWALNHPAEYSALATACISNSGCVSGLCSAQPPTCTSWDYSDWSSCVSGTEKRTITVYNPAGCSGGNPEPLSRTCTVTPPTCTSWRYSDWSSCVNGQQTKTIIEYIPAGCSGGTPEPLTQTCTATKPTCTSWTYTDWGACETSTNTQKRTIKNSLPAGCVGGTPELSRPCPTTIPTCTWTYSGWGDCNPTTKEQTQTVTGGPNPPGCTGGTQEALTRACTPPAAPTGCAALSPANCTGNPACQLIGSACSEKPKFTEICTGPGAGNCSEGQCIAFEGNSICRKTCTANTDCPTGNFCFDSGAGKFCRTLLQTGAACTDGAVCASGVCEATKCKAPIKCTDYSTADTTGAICNSHPECEWVSNACSTKAASGSSKPDNGGGSTPPPASTYSIPNFLSAGGAMDDPSSLVARIIKFIMGFAGTIALVTFMYGGALWLISAGRMDYVTKGKNYMIWAVIGLALVFGSYIILGQVLTILGK